MCPLEGPDLIFSKAHSTGTSVPGRPVAKTRILVLEEHPLLRDGITDFLNAQRDLLVCGEADNIRDARNEIAKSKPQLLVTALRLGTGDSLEFVKALKAEKPGLPILVYSAFEEAIFAERTLRAGADGYVMKTAPKEELLAAIREILSGNIYVSNDVAMRAFKKSLETRSEQQQRSARPTIGIEKLSDRETHIFFLLGSGLGNTQIANSLNLSVKTIESHRENIKHKLDLSCSRDLVACAKKYVEVTFVPPTNITSRGKKKVVHFPAA
jgi:DNA-binding NarL/FixJ family response regulator